MSRPDYEAANQKLSEVQRADGMACASEQGFTSRKATKLKSGNYDEASTFALSVIGFHTLGNSVSGRGIGPCFWRGKQLSTTRKPEARPTPSFFYGIIGVRASSVTFHQSRQCILPLSVPQ